MTIEELRTKKEELGNQVDVLIEKKKSLYSNMDIESPMSADEKTLTREIALIFSEIGQVVRQINKLKKQQAA